MKPSSLTQRSSSATRVLRRHARRLRQLAHADEIRRIERADAMDEVVADLRPFAAHALVADVMAHAGGARREDGEVGAALALQLELRAFEALPDLVVGDLQRAAQRRRGLALDRLGLLLAEAFQVVGLGGVVAVAIDDHERVAAMFRNGDATARDAIVKPSNGGAIGRRPAERAAKPRPLRARPAGRKCRND